MGLAISVGAVAELTRHDPEGLEWVRDQIQRLQSLLSSQGLPSWDEPEDLDVGALGMRAHLLSFPYSTIHYLARAYAWVTEYPDRELTPVGPEGLQATRPMVDDAVSLLSSHLLCHSDSEGWYVPVDFAEPIFAPRDAGIWGGGMVGSSHRLLAELLRVAPALGIRLDADGSLSDAEAARVYRACTSEGPWYQELSAWLTLHENARASLRHRTAIWFH